MVLLRVQHHMEKFKVTLFVGMVKSSLISFFANDYLLFCKSTLEECVKIQELLACNKTISGQVINKDKITLFFSRNTDMQVQEAIKGSLNVPAIQHYEKYLRLLSFIGREKKACFT